MTHCLYLNVCVSRYFCLLTLEQKDDKGLAASFPSLPATTAPDFTAMLQMVVDKDKEEEKKRLERQRKEEEEQVVKS